MTKSYKVKTFRLEADEADAWEQAAQAKGMSLAAYVRAAVNQSMATGSLEIPSK